MFSTRRVAVLFAAGWLLCASHESPAKGPNYASIIFYNETSVQVGVTTDANNAAILSALSSASIAAYTAAGGEVLNAGANYTFHVQTGTYTLGAVDFSGASTGVVLTQITESQSVTNGFTTKVYIKPTGNTTFPTIQFSSTP